VHLHGLASLIWLLQAASPVNKRDMGRRLEGVFKWFSAFCNAKISNMSTSLDGFVPLIY
jgi:hypothetical protein